MFENKTTSGAYHPVPAAAGIDNAVARRSHDDAHDGMVETAGGIEAFVSPPSSKNIELTAIAVATTPRIVEQGDGEANARRHNDDADDSSEEHCVWTDTHFDHHRQGTILAVFDHYPPSYHSDATWDGAIIILASLAFGGVLVSFTFALAEDSFEFEDWLVVLVWLCMLLAVLKCSNVNCLEKKYPSRIISHTALTSSGIRHELVPEEHATTMTRPCVVKIPYSQISSIQPRPGVNYIPALNTVHVVTKSTDDETKYIGSGIPLCNHTFFTSGHCPKEVTLNLYGLMEPYRFKNMVMARVSPEVTAVDTREELNEVAEVSVGTPAEGAALAQDTTTGERRPSRGSARMANCVFDDSIDW